MIFYDYYTFAEIFTAKKDLTIISTTIKPVYRNPTGTHRNRHDEDVPEYVSREYGWTSKGIVKISYLQKSKNVRVIRVPMVAHVLTWSIATHAVVLQTSREFTVRKVSVSVQWSQYHSGIIRG